MAFVIDPPARVTLPVKGSDDLFPVHRIYCVGRNYADHAIEMGRPCVHTIGVGDQTCDLLLRVPATLPLQVGWVQAQDFAVADDRVELIRTRCDSADPPRGMIEMGHELTGVAVPDLDA